MTNVVGVSFRHSGKIYYFNPAGIELNSGDMVIVKTAKGLECGEVDQAPMSVPEADIVRPLKKIIRRATETDRADWRENRAREDEAFTIAQKKIAEHKLNMRLVSVELLFDRSKMTFYFIADERVDFRELVKDLAAEFKTRIELRQIGVRDKAKLIGGLGHCGQRLCCTVFLGDLNPVSIKMAKEQRLTLNPQKISGVCGRLMCCLRYEYETYKDFNKRAPKKGSCVKNAAGKSGEVVDLDVVKEEVIIKNQEGLRVRLPLAEISGCKCNGNCGKKKENAANVAEE